MKLNRTYYKYVENELYNYNNNKKELEDLEDEIIYSSSPQTGERVKSSALSDETASKGLRLISSSRLNQIQRTLVGIERSIKMLKADSEDSKYKLLEMKYFDCQYTDTKIAQELNISIETYYRWKRQIINLTAINIGLL